MQLDPGCVSAPLATNVDLFASDMPHDTDYPYPIRIVVVFQVIGPTAVLHFDTDLNKMYGDIIFKHIMYASQNYSTMEYSFTVSG